MGGTLGVIPSNIFIILLDFYRENIPHTLQILSEGACKGGRRQGGTIKEGGKQGGGCNCCLLVYILFFLVLVSLWLEVRQVLDLIVHIVEQHTGMQLILCHWLEGQFIEAAAHPKYYLLSVWAECHLYYIALRELECLYGEAVTFMLLF